MNQRRPESPDASEPPPRLLVSLRQLAFTFLGMAQTRLALAGVEIEETLQWLVRLLLGAAGVLVFGLAGLLTATAMIVLAAGPDRQLAVLALLAVAYLGVGAWFWWRIQQTVMRRPVFLQATLAVMAQDRDALQQATAPEAAISQASHE
jgi:uncharacterized membrane protein YqjE